MVLVLVPGTELLKLLKFPHRDERSVLCYLNELFTTVPELILMGWLLEVGVGALVATELG